MKLIRTCSAVMLLVCLVSPAAFAQQGAGMEWQTLNQEVTDLYRTGKYERAVVVAKKALELAEKNVGPNHPDVATSLENMAALYRATKREKEAEKLEQRAAKIRAIKR